jgi:hypothetical protein
MIKTANIQLEIPSSETLTVNSSDYKYESPADLFLRGELDLHWFEDSEYGENPSERSVELAKKVLGKLEAQRTFLDRISPNGEAGILLIFKNSSVVEIDSDLLIVFENESMDKHQVCSFENIEHAIREFFPINVSITSGSNYFLAA